MPAARSNEIRLYRYMRFDKYGPDNLDKICSGAIRLTPPIKFNDPYEADGALQRLIPSSDQGIESLRDDMFEWLSVTDLIGYKAGTFIRDKLVAIHEDVQSDEKELSDEHAAEIKGFLSDVMFKKLGMACFTSTYESELMWAHYADSHQGLCIEYTANLAQIEKNTDFVLLPVTYTNRRPTFYLRDTILAPDRLLTAYLATKSLQWSYEEEYRLIGTNTLPEECRDKNGPPAFVPVPKGLRPSAIFVGCRAHCIAQESAVNAAQRLGIRCYQMEADGMQFRLNCVPLNESATVYDQRRDALAKLSSTL